MDELDFAAKVAAAAEEMRRKGMLTEIKTETLPPEVRKIIEDHEQRLKQAEQFLNALIREAANKLKDVA